MGPDILTVQIKTQFDKPYLMRIGNARCEMQGEGAKGLIPRPLA